MIETSEPATTSPPFVLGRRRRRVLGLSADQAVKAFFGGNALVAIVVLALITVFLLREGLGFFGQNRENLEVYRRAGLEYVDIMRGQVEDHTVLTRYLSDLRLRQYHRLAGERKLGFEEINAQLADYDAFADRVAEAASPLRGFVSDLGEQVSAIKEKFILMQDRREERRQLLAVGMGEKAAAVAVTPVDFEAELRPVLGTFPAYRDANREFATQLATAMQDAPAMPTPEMQRQMDRFKELVREYLAGFPETERRLERWDHRKPVPFWESFTAFIFGREWLTASFWQDWYGVLPLLAGSFVVSFVALCIGVPLGVGSAIYVNQIAGPWEQRMIKPAIEFIAAIPSVVLGFFGIAILGETLRALSNEPWLSWIPGFPYSERLNVLTAGCLLALMAVPTIFTLTEDALNNVPRAYKEASYALGASRLQTIIKIIIPASLSGLVSAVLLGLGRVIGETMVVLLCAGNRIIIPDFTAGLGIVTQPVHTMTGIIAQEMGEVVRGSIHYRALFVVGIVLFVISLTINFLAQKVVHRYRISLA